MVGAIEGFRWSLGGSGKFPATSFGISVAVAVVLFVSGLYYFRSAEDTFADFI
jgi:ABC-type polysaccharide/polyol phosphate export permease